MNQKLTDLLRKKQRQAASGASVNWDDRRDKYVAAVRNLYQQIETILAEPLKRKAFTLARRPKQLTENYIGTYSVDDLILAIGDEQVRFSPAGRNIAGAAGRVDVIGERGEATLLVQPKARWGLVETRQPTLRVVPFDESALTDVLQRVMRD